MVYALSLAGAEMREPMEMDATSVPEAATSSAPAAV
ncbi:hypothetical protein Vi05172_g4887 [Venturia inaequalis]|nr:hypothetical protein Vi05172_g4887 [Venturia inaequalis]